MFSFGASKSKSKSTSNPWGPQGDWLKTGFGMAGDLVGRDSSHLPWYVDPNQMQTGAAQQGFQQAQGAQGVGEMFGGMGTHLAGGLPGAQGFQQGLMTGQIGQFDNPFASETFDAIRGDSWGQPYQHASDQAWKQIMENTRRSDFGDAMGASLAGQGAGAGSDRYLQARQNAMGQGLDAFGQAEVGLRMQGLQSAEQRAGQWAGSQMQGQQQQLQNQIGAAGQMGQMGMAGMDMLQQGAQAAAGWGDYMGGFDRERMEGQHAQFQQPMQDLLNAWNIWGGANWGGTTKGKQSGASFGIG